MKLARLASGADRAVKGALDASLRPHRYTYATERGPFFTELAIPNSVRGYAPMGVQGLLDILDIHLDLSVEPAKSREGRQTCYVWQTWCQGRTGWFGIAVEPSKLTFQPTHQLEYYFRGRPCFTEKSTLATPSGANPFLQTMGYVRQPELERIPLRHGGVKVRIPLIHQNDPNQKEMLVVDMVPLLR